MHQNVGLANLAFDSKRSCLEADAKLVVVVGSLHQDASTRSEENIFVLRIAEFAHAYLEHDVCLRRVPIFYSKFKFR